MPELPQNATVPQNATECRRGSYEDIDRCWERKPLINVWIFFISLSILFLEYNSYDVRKL